MSKYLEQPKWNETSLSQIPEGWPWQPGLEDDPDMRVTGTHKAPGGHFPPSAALATDLANKRVLALLLVQELQAGRVRSTAKQL